MPRSTQRAHKDPAWLGDRPAYIDHVARMALGADKVRAADLNFQVALKSLLAGIKAGVVVFNIHWADPLRNNYTWILRAGGRSCRRMTSKELHRTKWAAADVRRWRRTRSPKSARPQTYAAIVRIAASRGVIVIAELKDVLFARLDVMVGMVADALRAKHPPWFMALYGSMPKCKQKCSATIRAGGQFAVIFGRYQWRKRQFKIAVRTWAVKPTEVW